METGGEESCFLGYVQKICHGYDKQREKLEPKTVPKGKEKQGLQTTTMVEILWERASLSTEKFSDHNYEKKVETSPRPWTKLITDN